MKSSASLVSLLLGAYGAVIQFFPLIAVMFYWKQATTRGATAGLLTGSLITISYAFMVKPPSSIHAGIYGLIANTIVLIIVSLATRPMGEDHVENLLILYMKITILLSVTPEKFFSGVFYFGLILHKTAHPKIY